MDVFKNIFRRRNKLDHDNEKLTLLLNKWAKTPSVTTYEMVMKEIVNGNSYLLLPTVDDGGIPRYWTISNENTTLKLTTVDERDGLKTLWAFSDEGALSKWAEEKTPYAVLGTKSVLTICENENIEQIVININSPNVFLVKKL
ncbi:MAG: SseB family protein [Mucilaginibacter sp.]